MVASIESVYRGGILPFAKDAVNEVVSRPEKSCVNRIEALPFFPLGNGEKQFLRTVFF
jgi:hypothetical protein